VNATVIGHGIGGNYIPIDMAQLAESQSLEEATMVCHPPIFPPLKTILMALRSKYVDATYY
jgi:hypothetical protein